MKNKTIAIGHINPDLDSVLSAIIVSKFGKRIFGFDVEAVVAGEINNETKFILQKVGLKKPKILQGIKNEKVVLLDTTEPSQIIDGLTEDNLLAIIDHHNLGGLKSSKPIYSRAEPIGCTCSIIYKILKERSIEIDKISSILMISSIISDTLNLTSPSTTSDDRKILKELNKIARLELKKFIEEQFAAKSSLEGISIEDIVGRDFKHFDMGRNKVGIGVWETANPESINTKEVEIMNSLLAKKKEQSLEYVYFLVVDILKNNSQLYIIGDNEKKLAEDVFRSTACGDLIFLPGVVSRKKQIVPPLMNKLK